MAARKRTTKRKSTAKRKRSGGQIPLGVLEKRLHRLEGLVARRKRARRR